VRSAKISAGKRGCCARVLEHSPSVDSLEVALPDRSRRGQRTELGMGPTGSAVIAVAAWSQGRPRLSTLAGKNFTAAAVRADAHIVRARTRSPTIQTELLNGSRHS
jgi:hypothetical protein